MVRSIGIVTLLAVTSLAWGQQPPAPAGTGETISITLTEAGKPAKHCKVLKQWQTATGAKAYEVQVQETGEVLHIENDRITPVSGAPSAPSAQPARAATSPSPERRQEPVPAGTTSLLSPGIDKAATPTPTPIPSATLTPSATPSTSSCTPTN